MNSGEILPERSPHVRPTSSAQFADIISPRCWNLSLGKQSRARRPGVVSAAICVFCNGVCTARRCHHVHEDHGGLCMLGCVDELDWLRHCNQCPRIAHMPLLHDLLTQVTCRSDQYCVLALGLADAFVHAFNQQRRNRDDPGLFKDCMQGRIRLMTALAPAYANVHQTLCGTWPG